MSSKSAKLISVAGLGLLVVAALGPGKWVPRSGLGWQVDHVVGYLTFTWMFCLAWGRPLVVGGALTAFAVLLEGLQVFTPDRHADLHAAMYNAGTVLSAALIAECFMRAPRLPMGRMLLMLQPFRLLSRGWNNPRAALLMASGWPPLLGSGLARAVAPQSPASVGLLAQPIPVRVRRESLLREPYRVEAGSQF